MTTEGAKHRRTALFYVLVSIALLAGIELAIRLWSYATGGPVVTLARQSPVASFGFSSDDPWQFDERHGFVGTPPRAAYMTGGITNLNGACRRNFSSWPENELGPAWAAADVRIGLFGTLEALMQPDANRPAWGDQLAGELSRSTAQRVQVVNYSRPNVGVVQSIMLAADVAVERQLDVVVLAPTTPTLALDFVYRGVFKIAGVALPLVSSSPRLREQPEIGARIGPIVNARVTEAWCSRLQEAARLGMTGVLRLDGLVTELQLQASVADMLANQSLVPSWFSPIPALFSVSRQWPRFRAVQKVSRLSPASLGRADLSRDPRVADAFAKLRQAGIPVIVMHVPIFPELRDRALLSNYAGAAPVFVETLLRSVTTLSGRPMVHMFDALERDVGPDAKKIVNNPENDWNLHVEGTEFYSSLAARSLAPVLSQIKPKR